MQFSFTSSTPTKPRQQQSRRLRLERLEDRALLSTVELLTPIAASAMIYAEDMQATNPKAPVTKSATWDQQGQVQPTNPNGSQEIAAESGGAFTVVEFGVSPGNSTDPFTLSMRAELFDVTGKAAFTAGSGVNGGDPIEFQIVRTGNEALGNPVRVTLTGSALSMFSSFPNNLNLGYTYQVQSETIAAGSFPDTRTERQLSFDAFIGENFKLNFDMEGELITERDGNIIGKLFANVKIKVEPIPVDIALRDATTNLSASLGTDNFRRIQLKYAVVGPLNPADLKFAVYQSADMTLDGSDTRLSSSVAAGATQSGAQLVLQSPVTLSYGRRFLIVKADPDNALQETNENNNELFVIPLLAPNNPGGFQANGVFRVFPNASAEDAVAGAIKGRISRNTPDFTNVLRNASTAWKNFGGTFKNEEPKPYGDKPGSNAALYDDHYVNASLLGANGPLTKLMQIIAVTDKQGRFTKSGLKITEAFDEQMEHRFASQHYEGRSVDFSAAGDRAKKLAGLTILAGFRWSVNEIPKMKLQDGTVILVPNAQHVHVSHTGSNANLSITNLRKALVFGHNNGLIFDARFNQLNSLLNQAVTAAGDSNLTVSQRATKVKAALDAFIASIPDSQPSGFVVSKPSSLAGQPSQKTLIHLLLKRNAITVRTLVINQPGNPALWL